ncbi:MAG: (2Fe-2S)-binding protein [Acidimicrobiia bacterium]|nr:(2Fe-2S)-binding protein [Acidimicrobiia bacterium]
MMICHCEAVNDRTILELVAEGATDVEDIIVRCGAGGGCRGCWPELRKLLGQPVDVRRGTMANHAG